MHIKPACPKLSSPMIPTVRLSDTARIEYVQSGTNSPSIRLGTLPPARRICTTIKITITMA